MREAYHYYKISKIRKFNYLNNSIARSGGRPITALSPDIIIGRSIKIGFCNIASISNSSLLVRSTLKREIFSRLYVQAL